MKFNKPFIYSLVLLVAATALYRVMPDRPLGFAPQIAVALFAGSIFQQKKYAFALPLFSMLISDLLYQALYSAGLTDIRGFYSGQWLNYLLFAGLTVVGFFVQQRNPVHIAAGSVVAPTLFFLTSNFAVWLGGGGLHRARTIEGLMQTYVDGIPFYTNSIWATALFAAIFFGFYALASGRKAVAQ